MLIGLEHGNSIENYMYALHIRITYVNILDKYTLLMCWYCTYMYMYIVPPPTHALTYAHRSWPPHLLGRLKK